MTDPTPRALDADNDGQPDYSVETITVGTALEAIPRPVRLALYVVYALGGPVLIYAQSRGWIGTPELELWLGVGTVLGITAAGNTRSA